MPKLYEYFGLVIMFYANEHDPMHVHGKCQEREARAELVVLNGVITEIRYNNVAGRQPLGGNEMKFFREIVSARAEEIVAKWVDFFVMHKPITPETITWRLK